jgi:hypothetical protein
MGAAFLLVVFAERLADRLDQHVGHGGFTEHSFHAGSGGIESAVQRAETQRVVRVADRAFGDASRGLDGRHDRQQR